MSSRIAVISIDAVQPRLVADFWCRVLGWQVVDEDGSVISIAPQDGSWPTIDVVAVPEKKTVKNRLHFDVRADGTATADELGRLLSLGRGARTWARGPTPRGWSSPIPKAMSSVCSPDLSKKPGAEFVPEYSLPPT